MNPPPARASVLRAAPKSSLRVSLPDGVKNPAGAPGAMDLPGEDELVGMAVETNPDPGLSARWLQQAVIAASLVAAIIVFGTALNAGCSLLTAVVRASMGMTSVAGLCAVLAHVLTAQLAERTPAATNETRKTV
ncbi:MAG: hypothetical protein WCT04_00420 [Planctomycetota bacterium]